MSTAERLRAEGRAAGRTEGRIEGRAEGRIEGQAEGQAEGRADGKRQALVHLAQQRLGAIPPAAMSAIAAADEAALDRWLDRLLTARAVADLLA